MRDDLWDVMLQNGAWEECSEREIRDDLGVYCRLERVEGCCAEEDGEFCPHLYEQFEGEYLRQEEVDHQREAAM